MPEISASTSLLDSKRLLDTPAAADVLGISPETMRKWRHRGIGPAYVQLSRSQVRYRIADLDKWIKSRLIGGSSRG